LFIAFSAHAFDSRDTWDYGDAPQQKERVVTFPGRQEAEIEGVKRDYALCRGEAKEDTAVMQRCMLRRGWKFVQPTKGNP
jgi:hypothetical protein